MHHAGFKYILRGLVSWKAYLNDGKFITPTLKGLPRRLVSVDRQVHRQLHEAFDTTYKECRRREGWQNIRDQLIKRKTTPPAELFRATGKVTKEFLTGPELDQALSELRRLRKLF